MLARLRSPVKRADPEVVEDDLSGLFNSSGEGEYHHVTEGITLRTHTATEAR